jgi:signal transduction histidine kinase
MIAITTRSSIKVKPRRVIVAPALFRGTSTLPGPHGEVARQIRRAALTEQTPFLDDGFCKLSDCRGLRTGLESSKLWRGQKFAMGGEDVARCAWPWSRGRMRWSIREQVLVPIIAIQTVTVVAITLASVALAARRAERQVVERLNGVVDVLTHSSFPLTEGILARMHGLSGARFVAYGAAVAPIASSEPGLIAEAPDLGSIRARSQETFHSLSDLPTLAVAGQDHFAARVAAHTGTAGVSLLVLYPEASWREARWESAQVPLWLGAGALTIMAAAATWVVHRISRRIHRLEQQVAGIAKGDFREVQVHRPAQQDEVSDLARSINGMCGQLRQMSQTIRRSERASVLAQLAAGLAHQLRNALTGARISIQLHEKRCELARTDASLNVALRQLALTEEQVRGLLTLGRVEERPHEPTDLANLIEDVADLLQSTCEHSRVDLEVLAGRSIVAPVDVASLRAAVLNLVQNAVEAAGPGGSVVIELIEIERAAVIQVGDSGPGPPPELEPMLGEPFVTGKASGVGLGLALVHHVAEAHQGRLSWRRDGGWTRFRLTLPLALQSALQESVNT